MRKEVVFVRPEKYFGNIFGAGIPLVQVVSVERVGYNERVRMLGRAALPIRQRHFMSRRTARTHPLYRFLPWLALSGEMQQRLPFRWRGRKGYRARAYCIPP